MLAQIYCYLILCSAHRFSCHFLYAWGSRWCRAFLYQHVCLCQRSVDHLR